MSGLLSPRVKQSLIDAGSLVIAHRAIPDLFGALACTCHERTYNPYVNAGKDTTASTKPITVTTSQTSEYPLFVLSCMPKNIVMIATPSAIRAVGWIGRLPIASFIPDGCRGICDLILGHVPDILTGEVAATRLADTRNPERKDAALFKWARAAMAGLAVHLRRALPRGHCLDGRQRLRILRFLLLQLNA
jgi:hypothetical protein